MFKSLALLVVFFLVGKGEGIAQDTLVLNDGSEIYAKVIEVGEGTISYKKKENLDGPTYTINLSKLFMAIYKGGKRETFPAVNNETKEETDEEKKQTETKTGSSNIRDLSNENFRVKLIAATATPDKKDKWLYVSATVEVFINERSYTLLTISSSQKKNKKTRQWESGAISFWSHSKQVRELLYNKYENEYGRGTGWTVPANFFATDPSSCTVYLNEQKKANNNVIGYRISSGNINLQDCSSLEAKILSASDMVGSEPDQKIVLSF